ncbi:MAG: large-conductance mechanosensitive channel protein MscL [Lachnospiraceae bacterium]|nr:large-conductance mechanosensitive channel protein MscL [Lachnospiraceae bacterium]
MGGFMKEFKEFIARGNVMNMAVGIIIGGAFGAIITALVDNVIGPIIGMAIGGIDFSKLAITVGSAQLMIGAFIQAIINFLITAFVLFCIIKAFNKFQKEQEPEPEPEPETPADIVLLTEIRDLLKK